MLAAAAATAAMAIVAGCTSSSDGAGTGPSSGATATVTTTDTVSSAAPPTGSGVPASSTAPVATATTTAAAAGPGLCTPTVMRFRLGAGEGAAGTQTVPVIATNASQQPCVTTGYPGVAVLNAAGAQIAQAKRVAGGVVSTTLVVQPGEQISALIGSASMGAGGVTCPTSPAILFTLPDNTDSTRIVAGIPGCADGVSVGPFVKGTTGR